MHHTLTPNRPLNQLCGLRRVVVASALAVSSLTAAQAAQIDVGVGTGCEHDNLNAALLAAAFNPGPDTIRLTTTVAYTNVSTVLTNWSGTVSGAGPLTLSGGWTSCSAATTTGITTVSGNGNDPVFTVEATAGNASEVDLMRLELTGGSPGLLVTGNSTVDLATTEIRNNEGGIRVTTGAKVDVDYFSLIISNDGATFGGGIRCADANSQVTLRGIVTQNSATGAGGGIYAQSNCQVFLREAATVSLNEAPQGGGLYLTSGAQVDGGGTGAIGVVIEDNTATDAGGGFFVNGTGTESFLANTRVLGNSAANRGGGVALTNGGVFHLERFNFETCAAPPHCAVLSENTTTVGGEGSAVYAASGSLFRMYQGFIERNEGPLDAGFLLFAEDDNTGMYLEGVQLWDNRTVALFEAQNQAEIVAGMVTAAANTYLPAGVPPMLDSRGAQASGGANIEIYTSILVDQRPFVANTGTIHGDCLLLDTADGLTTSTGSPIVGLDPMFRNPAVGNLRLKLTSPALDACDNSRFNPIDADYDVNPRGFDLSVVPNVLGPFDRGADEVLPIFVDGFETGSTSAWTATVP